MCWNVQVGSIWFCPHFNCRSVTDSICLCQVLNGLQTPTVWQLLTAGTETGELSKVSKQLADGLLTFTTDISAMQMVLFRKTSSCNLANATNYGPLQTTSHMLAVQVKQLQSPKHTHVYTMITAELKMQNHKEGRESGKRAMFELFWQNRQNKRAVCNNKWSCIIEQPA